MLGWQESLTLLAQLVEPEIPDQGKVQQLCEACPRRPGHKPQGSFVLES